MKKHYKLKLFAVLVIAAISIGDANAFTIEPTSTTIIAKNSDNWVEIQNENGIKVFFTDYQLDGNSYLKIRFENLTNENLHFEWSLMSKEGKFLINRYVNQIEANKATDFIDSTMPILISTEEMVTDFSITLNIK